jgi:uncharacterized damage-inducible protein DinB
LEQVDIEQERALLQEKEKRQKEWLQQVKQEQQEEKPFIPWDDECELPKPDQETL